MWGDLDHGFSRACPSGNHMLDETFWPKCSMCGTSLNHSGDYCKTCERYLEEMDEDMQEQEREIKNALKLYRKRGEKNGKKSEV